MSHRRIAALALAAAMLTVSGCGGSAKSTSSAASTQTSTQTPAQVPSQVTTPQLPAPTTHSAPLTRAHLAAQVNAICRRTSSKRDQFVAKSQVELASLLPVVASYQRKMYAELVNLSPPASLASDWKQFVAKARTLAESSM